MRAEGRRNAGSTVRSHARSAPLHPIPPHVVAPLTSCACGVWGHTYAAFTLRCCVARARAVVVMTTNEDVVSAGAQVGPSVAAAAAAAAAAAQPEKHARYSVTGIVGKGTFGRVFKTRRTDTNIFVPEAKMARSLVLKHSMVIPTAVLRARPQLGSISGLPFDDAENADEEEAACSEEGGEGFACRRLRGIIARNREARVLNDLSQPVRRPAYTAFTIDVYDAGGVEVHCPFFLPWSPTCRWTP
ncbi:hypothetical protein EON66_05650 [archaeon]|nr:MAG: hypothetical protein EON66_05650 [archaeon]